MELSLIADAMLAAGAIGAGLYCFVLARKLAKFSDLENGMGSAVAVLSSQVEELQATLEAAQNSASGSANSLQELTARAEAAEQKLEIMMAALHDVPKAMPDERVAPREPMFARHKSGAA